MDKEFAEVFKEEIVNEGKIEELGKQIAGLADKFKEGKDDVMTMADEMITNGTMPDPEMIKMLETEEGDMVIHLIAKKMGVQWTKDNGYGEMRFKQNYPESTDMVMNLLGKRKVEIDESKEREISVDEGLMDKVKSIAGMGPAVKNSLIKLKKSLSTETKETKEMALIYKAMLKGKASNSDIKKANEQFKDILKGVGLTTLALMPIPGGGLLMAALIKFAAKFNISLMPSAFYEGFDLEEAMNPKDHVKEKDGKFEVIAPSGKVVYSSDDKKEAEEWAVKNHDALMKEEVEIDEAKMKPDMIDTLKKKYESLRGKRLSLGQNMEIAKIVSGMSRDKEVLIQLVKADIPFISLNAATLLMDKHGMKAKDIKLGEEVGVDGRTKGFKEALRRLTYEKLRKMKQEGIDIQKADMKDVIKDFQTSDAPQFKGKSDKKKKEMAIAAKLSKEENEDDDPVGKSKKKSNKDVINLKPTAESSMKKFKDIMTKLKEKRFNTAEETTNLKKEVEIEESDGYEVEMAAKKISPQQWKRMSKAEKVRFLDKMDVLAGKTKVSDSDLEDILGDRGLTMEASGDKEAYQKFFQGALKKYGVKSPAELKGDKKKEFFDYVDKNWTGDHEEETKKEETMTKKSLKDAVSNMKEKKSKVQEALTIGGVEVGEQDFDKQFRLDNAAPNLGMTYADYQAKFKTDGLEGPYQIDGGAYFWDKAATKWFSVETEDYVDGKRNAELNFRYTKQGTAGGGLMHTRRL